MLNLNVDEQPNNDHLAMTTTPLNSNSINDECILGPYTFQIVFSLISYFASTGSAEGDTANNPTFGLEAIFQCSGSQMMQIQTQTPTPQGITLAFHFRPTGPITGSKYSIMSIRSRTTSNVLFSVDYIPSTGLISISNRNSAGSWVLVYTFTEFSLPRGRLS